MIAPKEAFRKKRPPRFRVGQLVRHVRYGYRGVVVALDERCQASEAWYANNQTQPSRAQSWYHVLVDGATYSTYAAQDSLVADEAGECIVHPWVEQYFSAFGDAGYTRNDTPWPHDAP